MKNLIDERPNSKLTGRLKKSIEFLDSNDISRKSIVNVGCGYGWFEKKALKLDPKSILGVEISESDLLTIKKYIQDKKFKAKIGHSGSIPAKNNTIDTVVAWEVIEHIPKNTEDQFFQEVRRILKKDGTFYISTPYRSFVSTVLDPAFWLIGHRHYTYKQLSEFGFKHNFSVEKIEVVGGIWTAVSLINMYISKWILRRKPIFNHFFSNKEEMEYKKKGNHNIYIKYRKLN